MKFREQLKQTDARQVVVVDESGSNIALTPLYGRAPKGQRAYGRVPRHRGKNTTLLAALSLDGVGASMIIEGAVNAVASARVCGAHPGSQPLKGTDGDPG